MVMPNSREMIFELMPQVDAYLLGVFGLTVNFPDVIKKEELKDIILQLNANKKEVFISLNKNMHNKDLALLEEVMDMLNELPIKGVFYYDMAVLTLKEEKNYQFDLVWAQEHLLTNSSTANFYYDLGVKYGLVATEITLEEILALKKETKMELIVPIFGHLPMFTSYRNLVNNYLLTFNSKKDKDLYFIEKEGRKYPIVDNLEGTTIYSDYLLDGLKEMDNLALAGINYFLFNSFLMTTEEFMKVLKIARKDDIKDLTKYINKHLANGFLYQETIYRVKKNEKK